MASCVRDLNRIYRAEPSLWEKDFTPDGFEGINLDDPDNSSISFIRRGNDPQDFTVIAINFTPVPRTNYRIGVPELCQYREIFNSDAASYGGSNCGNAGGSMAFECHAFRFPYSLDVVIPPLGAVIFKPDRA
jgi:1,4-alpha-glucan branching enzyme